MTQNGIVTRVLDKQMAEVAVQRGTACGGHCGGNCSSCEACAYDARILVKAVNLIYAGVGERVVVTGKTSHLLGSVCLIYLLPLVFFFGAYVAAAAFSCPQGLCVLISFLGIAVGAAVSVFFGRRRKEMIYKITSYQS